MKIVDGIEVYCRMHKVRSVKELIGGLIS